MSAAALTGARGNPAWLRRIAAMGFWFFLIKGILWLAAPVVFYHLL